MEVRARWVGAGAVLLVVLFLGFADFCCCGRTSSYVRSANLSLDMPLFSDVFRVPLGYNAPQQDRVSGKTTGSARLIDGLYYFNDENFANPQAQGFSSIGSFSLRNTIMLWHFRLGHPSFYYLKKLFPVLFTGLDCSSFNCEHCYFAKSHRNKYSLRPYRATKPFYQIHSDVWGPSRVTTLSKKRWFVTFIDDHTRLCWVYLMHEKSEVGHIFKTFYTMIETQFHTKISIFHSDNGTEYFNTILGDFFQEKGIHHMSTCTNTPQQNGIAERKNKHLLEVSRALMFTMNIPKYLWGEAVLTACYLINRMPTSILKFDTPIAYLKRLFGDTKLISDLPLKVFGCTVFLHKSDTGRSKLDPRADKCVFVGYAPTKKGYKCFIPTTRKIIVSMDVSFIENESYFSRPFLQGEKTNEETYLFDTVENHTPTQTTPLPLPIIEDSNTINNIIENNMPKNVSDLSTGGEILQNPELRVYSRRKNQQDMTNPSISLAPTQSSNPIAGNDNTSGIRSLPPCNIILPSQHLSDLHLPIAIRKPTRSKHPVTKYLSYAKLSPEHKAYTTKISNLIVPRNIQEAIDIPEWKVAVMEEMNALEKNGTWEITSLPSNQKTVGCKWVFTIKCNADGSVERYKARLVAKGFTQTYGIDYQETFAPVAKINSIRLLLSIASNFDWPLHQLDVKNAFLNGDLEEVVYMSLPPGFEESFGRRNVCKLKKSLYGLKQSPRAWFERFGKVVKDYGYLQSQADHTMFFKHSKIGQIAILIVYVDDIILTGDYHEELSLLKKNLAKEFEIKDLGVLKYFLGMEIARSRQGIFVNQRKYILDLLTETGLLGCKPVDTPVEANAKLTPAKPEDVIDKDKFQRLVGRLIYLAHTRPDITFAVSLVSQFMHSPGKEHFDAVYRILKYLKKTPGRGLMFKKNNHLNIEIYTDADWAGSSIDRRSTTGYCSFLGRNLVTWRSKYTER